MGDMFIEIAIVLKGAEFTVLLCNKDEGGCLREDGGSDLSGSRVLFKEVLGGFFFVRREGIDFVNLWYEGVVKVDLMIMRMGRGNMVSYFFGEDLSIVSILGWERDLGFHLFSGNGKLCCHSEFGNGISIWEELFAITSNDLVDEVVQRMLEVLVLHVMVQVVVKLGVIDSVYIDVSVGSGKGFLEERVMSLSISGMGGVKVLKLVTGFRDSQICFAQLIVEFVTWSQGSPRIMFSHLQPMM